MSLKVGIISDTHGLLRPEAMSILARVDHILHAGDIGKLEVIEALHRIAPVTAIRGNVDRADCADAFPETDLVQIGSRSIFLIHDIKSLQIDPAAVSIDAVVYGHTHLPKISTIEGVLYLNPGSAGRRRFKLPVTLATLEITRDGLRPTIHDLA